MQGGLLWTLLEYGQLLRLPAECKAVLAAILRGHLITNVYTWTELCHKDWQLWSVLGTSSYYGLPAEGVLGSFGCQTMA